jgi:anthranilate phosphoribosyltransferase
MWAQKHHSAMRHVGPSRVELGTRTIFNIMGPLSNPAGVKRQLLGVFAEQWLEPMAEVLRNLGTQHAWVVHGGDGLDEITTTTVTHVCELKDGKIRRFEISPGDYGIRIARSEELLGGDPQQNAQAIRELFDGAVGPYRDIVLLNAAAALVVAGAAKELRQGIEMAKEAIDFAKARKVLEDLIRVTNEPRPAE